MVKNDCGILVIQRMDKIPEMIMTSKSEHFDAVIAIGRKNKSGEKVKEPPAVLDYNQVKKGLMHWYRYYYTIRVFKKQSCHKRMFSLKFFWGCHCKCLG